MGDILSSLNQIIGIILGVWDLIIDFLGVFIKYPVKFFSYFLDFIEWFVFFIELLFSILVFIFNNIWFLFVIFIGINCVKTYFEHQHSPHERLIAFIQNCIHSGIYISKLMFFIFQKLYEISIRIIMRIIEMIPVIQ